MSLAEPDKLILGTRGSDLAMTQSGLVEAALIASGFPAEDIEIRVIRTIGDKRPDLKLSEFSQGENAVIDKGIFTKELEEALLSRQIDAAVHSLKDVPTELAAEFHIAATLPRAPVEDAVITKQQGWFGDSTGSGGTVATSSVRRARQMKWLRPDLEIVDIRGNVPTRVRKLIENNEWDAIMLACAGLERLGIITGEGPFEFEGATVFAEVLDSQMFLPAAGQGAVAIETLKKNEAANRAVSKINNAPTFQRITAERAFLSRLQAGCQTPVGAFTSFKNENRTLAMKVRVFDEDDPSAEPREAEAEAPADAPDALADAVFNQISHGEEKN